MHPCFQEICIFDCQLSFNEIFNRYHLVKTRFSFKNDLNPLCLTIQNAKARKRALELLHLHIGLAQAHNKVSRVFFGQNVKIKRNKKVPSTRIRIVLKLKLKPKQLK